MPSPASILGLLLVALAATSGCGGATAAPDGSAAVGDEPSSTEAAHDTLEFETVAAVIDDEWPVEAVVPRGWHVRNGFYGDVEVVIRDYDENGRLAATPGDETSIFTTMLLRTGCDGTCSATDWEARLNGPDGYLTERRQSKELIRDEAIADGWVQLEDDGRFEVEVIRWHDEAPRFLKCELEIDDDDVHLLDDFIDACAAASPGWFPG